MVAFLLLSITACDGGSSGSRSSVSNQYVVSGNVRDESGQGVGDVRLNLSGDETGYIETNTNGSWKATLSGNVVITPHKLGYNFEPASELVLSAESGMDFTAKPMNLKDIEEDFVISEIVEKSIMPSSEEQRVDINNDVTLIIPGDAIKQTEIFKIYSVSNYPELPEEYDSVVLYALELGNMQGLPREVDDLGIEFKLPDDLLEENDLKEVLEGIQWDRHENAWNFKSADIDLEAGTITIYTRDLGFGAKTFSVGASNVIGYSQASRDRLQKYRTIDSQNFRLTYNTQMNVTPDWQMDPEVMANDLLNILEDAYNTFTNNLGFDGFRSPWLTGGRLRVRLDTKYLESEWSFKTGIMYISAIQISRDEFRHEIAHELFHAIQNSYFSASGMIRRRWWMEATADYAAGFYYGTGQLSPLDPNFFLRPINSTNHRREYQAAHYLDYLSKHKGIDIKSLWDYTASYYRANVFNQIKSYLESRGLNADNTYRDFIRYSYLSTGTAMGKDLWRTSFTETFNPGDTSTNFSRSLYANGTAYLYSLYVLSEDDEDRNLEFSIGHNLRNGQSVELYVTDSANARFSGQPQPRAVLTGNDSRTLNLAHGQYVYALFINNSAYATQINLEIEDMDQVETEMFSIPVKAKDHNLAPVHVSFEGKVGPEADRVEPGSTINLSYGLIKDSEDENLYYNNVEVTLSRGGQEVGGSGQVRFITNNSTIIINEFYMNNFWIDVE